MATRSAAALRRDPELEDVLQDIEQHLAAIDEIRIRDHDEKLAAVEALAAPYALAFLHEIRRLDALLLRARKRATRRRRS